MIRLCVAALAASAASGVRPVDPTPQPAAVVLADGPEMASCVSLLQTAVVVHTSSAEIDTVSIAAASVDSAAGPTAAAAGANGRSTAGAAAAQRAQLAGRHAGSRPFRFRLPRFRFRHRPEKVREGPKVEGGLPVIRQLQDKAALDATLRTLIYSGFIAFVLFGILDWYRFASLPEKDAAPGGAAALLGSAGAGPSRNTSCKQDKDELEEWSMLGLVALTSYRFYTGFLSATWLPYLLAMEGGDLYSESQSLFMGIAKLIYGVTILFNPLFGLFGDRVVAVSHGIGRRLFLRAGIVIAGLGIVVCVLADAYMRFSCFIFGIFLWRIGEALNDVTTEALVPELVPQSQFAIASAIKATSFLLGGVSAYVMLIFMTDFHYTWLYWAYAIGMIVCAIPCQVLLCNDLPMRGKPLRNGGPFGETLKEAYISPTCIEGWFPCLCLAIFIFSFGTSPMFFLLLMIRDLVGASSAVQLQQSFSISSIIFFISAAVATIVGGLRDRQAQGTKAAAGQIGIKDPAVLISQLQTVVRVGIAYAVTASAIPLVCLFHSHTTRMRAFYCFSLLLGYCFGSGFARFQDISWQLIPQGTNVANAMGFNIMCRLVGVGVGNFIAGILLDCFALGTIAPEPRYQSFGVDADTANVLGFHMKTTPVYGPAGYVVICFVCGAVCLASSYISSRIAAGIQSDMLERPVPAA